MDTQNTDSFESKVNNLVSTVERVDGKLVFPEDADEALVYAARTEIRRRDTQSALQQERTEKQRLAAENAELVSGWEADVTDTLTAEEQSSLEELKHQDPDAWHKKLLELRDGKKAKFQEKRTEIANKAEAVSAQASRAEILNAFESQYPGVLTDDVLQNDIPPRYVKQLENGEVTYKQFLQNCVDYVQKDKVLDKGETAPKVTDLSAEAGGGAPSEAARDAQDSDDYSGIDSW